MQRRTFLKALGTSAAMGCSPFHLLGKNPTSSRGKVIVVGAGMAGVGAASQLQKAGWEVTVVEASGRIGGRIHTNRDWGFPIELGANWIHQATHPANPLLALAQSLQQPLFLTNYASHQLYEATGAMVPAVRRKKIYRNMQQELLQQVGTAAAGQSFGQLLQQVEQALALSTASEKAVYDRLGVEGTRILLGTALEQADALFYGHSFLEDSQVVAKDYLVLGGYDKLVQALAQDLEVQLHCKVLEIDDQSTKVQLHTNQGLLESDFVVVTVSLGVLKSQQIQFTKGLSAPKTAAIEQLGMGLINKVFLEFEEKFWKGNKHFYVFQQQFQKQYGIFLNQEPALGQAVWVALPAGEAAYQLSNTNTEQLKQYWQEQLRAFFPYKNVAIKRVQKTAWQDNPLFGGAYSYAKVGTNQATFEALAAPEGRVFFAGEATNAHHHGNVHSALITGQKAAQIINAR